MEYSPPAVERIWLWMSSNKIPIYPIFYLFNGNYVSSAASLAAAMHSASLV